MRNNAIVHGPNIILNLYKDDDEPIDYPESTELRLEILNAFLTTSPLQNPFQIVNDGKNGSPITLTKAVGTENLLHLYVVLHGFDMTIVQGTNQNELNAIFGKHILDVLVYTRIDRIKHAMNNVLEYEQASQFLTALNKFLLNVAN